MRDRAPAYITLVSSAHWNVRTGSHEDNKLGLFSKICG